jgi:hypothetical protein
MDGATVIVANEFGVCEGDAIAIAVEPGSTGLGSLASELPEHESTVEAATIASTRKRR